ncbi:uncharacterized protein [Rutidosis leptorrhynchoides]|uniref:uncharacterized protein n=1 Tax=Rutidosis leptorrhynchoides TaxID=125765 RepID=UPI003A993BA2
MTLDKSWTTLVDRTTTEFWNGLNAFIESCKAFANSANKCRCPCKDCDNLVFQTLDTMKRHIQMHGFTRFYKTWKYHGEQVVLPPQTERFVRIPPAVDQLHDLITDLRDVPMDTTHISNENEPTTTTHTPSSTYDELDKLDNTELYPGCTWMSSFSFLAKLCHMKVTCKWTNTSFDKLVTLLKTAFPDASIPSSYYEARKTMRTIGLGYESIHVCKYDCCLFWKEHANDENCHVCGESRWKDKNTTGKKVPHKVMRYFPLTPRLQRLYKSRFTANHMTWHASGQCTEAGKMHHPVDGTAWKNFNAKYPDFASEPRNVRLGLAADGFNPFNDISSTYSMWPVVLTTYNLPPWMCMKESSFMLTLLIPGPRSPGKDMDVFLRPLVDELKVLWSVGVKTNDAATNTSFTMRAMLLWTINDFPARSSLSGWSGQGYKACPTCNVDTPSRPVLSKIVYFGHRMFLKRNHKLRTSTSFDGHVEKRLPPRTRNKDEILAQLTTVKDRIKGKHPEFGGKKRKRDPTVVGNWSKKSIFYELDYWSDLELKHNLDVMHIEKNVCEGLLNILLMHKEKSKDNNKAREVLEMWGIRKELWLKPLGNGKSKKPHPKYSFKPDDRSQFCQFIKKVKLPDGFGSNFKHKVHEDENKLVGLKSHDHHIMMQRLLPIGVRAYLDKSISAPIIELCLFFKQLCARSLLTSDMVKAKDGLIKILCSFEQIFPPSFFDIMIHLVMHLPDEAIQGGPVNMRWMYPFERYMKKLKNYVKNKAKPEGSIAEGYVADEALTYASRYIHSVETSFNKPDRNAEAKLPKRDFYVFQSVCTPISKAKDTRLDTKLQAQLNWFVLNNSPEIDKYKEEFKVERPHEISDIETKFPRWFNDKIKLMRVNEKSKCSDELLALAHGPRHYYSYTGCIVNGVRFVVHDRDLRRTTQNSGVSSRADSGGVYYGVVEEILELCYLFGCKVVLFRCKWFKTDKKGCVTKDNITSIYTQSEWYTDQQYVLATQTNLVFYIDDLSNKKGDWKVVHEVHHRKHWDQSLIRGDDEMDLIHGCSSSDFSLSTNLDDAEDLTRLDLSMGEPMIVDHTPSTSNATIDVYEDDDEDDYEDDDDEDDVEEVLEDDTQNGIEIDSEDDLDDNATNSCEADTTFSDDSE